METPTDFEDAVEQLLHAFAVPRRLREPRVPERLQDVPPVGVDCRHGTLAVWRIGEGPAALLVHGYEDDSSLWSPLIDALVEREKALVVFDLPGHGHSDGEWGLGWEGADGIHAIAEAQAPIDSAVGHSVGAAAILGALSEGWHVERAVLIGPPWVREDRWARLATRLGASHAVTAAARERYESSHSPSRNAYDPEAIVGSLDTDLLVVHSRDDEHMPFDETVRVVSPLRRARLHPVDGLKHRRTARDPGVVEEIARFLS
jgi:pimeloyl-ACP methyl ester carboxylesterase